jgi:hypothetical protein
MQRYYSYLKKKLVYSKVSSNSSEADNYDLDDFTMPTCDSDYEADVAVVPAIEKPRAKENLHKVACKISSPEVDKIVDCQTKKIAELSIPSGQASPTKSFGNCFVADKEYVAYKYLHATGNWLLDISSKATSTLLSIGREYRSMNKLIESNELDDFDHCNLDPLDWDDDVVSPMSSPAMSSSSAENAAI